MSEERFNIVFYGIIQPGSDRNTVVAEMADMFKTTPDKIKPYFSGDRKVIKSNVDDLVAEKYRVTLERIGLVIKIEPAEAVAASSAGNTSATAAAAVSIDTGDLSVAEVGANVLEHPPRVEPVPIGDISDISLADVGANVLENPPQVTPAQIDDISDITLAETGADVLEHPQEVTPQPIADISDISLAQPGADLLENPPKKPAAPIPDISQLTLDKSN
ncbi:MAG: hypothetical protein WBN96_02380 [Gammaproteobacteria bacterium]